MKVYILDERGKNRDQLQYWLAEDIKTGTVETFEDYVRFIEKVGQSPPDFCFIRVGKSKIPGLITSEMVRQVSADIRVVFISNDRDYAVDAYEVGAYGYLVYPLQRDSVARLFRQ